MVRLKLGVDDDDDDAVDCAHEGWSSAGLARRFPGVRGLDGSRVR